MALVQTQTIDEEARQALFPIVRRGIFLGHAGVAPLPRVAAEKIQQMAHLASTEGQENAGIQKEWEEARAVAARLIGAKTNEISLIGPTALGLNLVAHGLPWEPGDEVIYYPGCYPSNVYPWTDLARRGVKPVALRPEKIGHLTPELVLAAVTPKTKLVALASCHFLTGYRVDLNAIGQELRRSHPQVLFSVDGIQSLGATEFDVEKAQIDFVSADSHKWLLGPLGAGIFYVRESRFPLLRPALLGSYNVNSPRFIAQEKIEFPDHGRRYECGAPNSLGIFGMRASMEMLLSLGIDKIETRLLQLHAHTAGLLRRAGWEVLSDTFPESAKSGIITFRKPGADLTAAHANLEKAKVTASLRWDLAGEAYLRFAPHFYNTEGELETAVAALG
jgi:selenocysteine lyase/cysteine desulfurase